MRRVVDLGERLVIEVSVNLRCRDARVAEQLLHRAQVLRRLEHMRGERVAQHVRVHALGDAGPTTPGREPYADHRSRDASTARADEKRLFAWLRELRSYAEPRLERLARLSADRHRARLRSLASHGDLSLTQVKTAVADIERHELAEPQPG